MCQFRGTTGQSLFPYVQSQPVSGCYLLVSLGGDFARFVALWHLYFPQRATDPLPVLPKPRAPLSHAEALKLFPIGFTFWKELTGGIRLQGQVYDYLHPYWRVRYNDQNWEELSRRELERLAK